MIIFFVTSLCTIYLGKGAGAETGFIQFNVVRGHWNFYYADLGCPF
jgi:hypothetical protein